MRSQIPIRTEYRDAAGPGYLEADTVAHRGESMAGECRWGITVTDVHTQWTDTRAVPHRGQHAVAGRIAQIRAVLPFPILGFDADNGGEFLNRHVAESFRTRPPPRAFTRSCPERKNDNARVEQKD